MKKSVFVVSSLLVLACGDNGDQEGHTNERSVLEDVDTDAVNTMLDPNEYPTFRFSSLMKPYEDSAGCLALHASKNPAETDDQTTCRCNKCVENMQECDVLQGCTEIAACSKETGCTDEYSCYLLPGAPCVDVIDRWGNASVAVTVSIDLLNCSKLNKCQ
ncbi:MAG: hypothetical protein QM778_26645 [Myxococcales bacterium]